MPKDIQSHSLADALAQLEADTTLSPSRKRDLRSAITRTANWLNRAPAALPTDAAALRTHLVTLHPAHVGISAKSLGNVKANLTRALQHTGHLPKDTLNDVNLLPQWQELFAQLSQNQTYKLMRLAKFASLDNVLPEDVTDDVMERFKAHLSVRILNKDPEELCKEMAQAWNGHVARLNLPFQTLAYARSDRHVCRPLTEYTPQVQREISAYLELLAGVDIFSDDGPRNPLRPTSLRNTEAHFRQYLDALVCDGMAATDIVSLRDVINVPHMKRAFQTIIIRHGSNTLPTTLQNIAATLKAYAKHNLNLPEADLRAITQVQQRVSDTSNSGMSQKTRNASRSFVMRISSSGSSACRRA